MFEQRGAADILRIIFKLIAAGLLVIIAWTDWRIKRIPNSCVLGVLASGIISIWIFSEISLMQRMTGCFCISIPLLVLACLIPGSIGGGDVKLLAAGGFLFGMRGIWNAFVMGIMSAGAYCIIVLFLKMAGRKSEIALGPFLCIGMVIEILKM